LDASCRRARACHLDCVHGRLRRRQRPPRQHCCIRYVADHDDNACACVNDIVVTHGHPNLHSSATHVGTDAHDDIVCWDANHNGAHTAGLAALDDNAAAGNWACSGTVGLTAVSDDRDIIAPTLQKWIGVVGLVVAPTTLVTALCYYFGYVSTRKSMAYLGIDSDAIGFTTNDYVTKSAGVLFVTVLTALVLSTGLLALCAYIRRLAKTEKHAGLLRAFGWTVVSVGAVCTIAGVAGVWHPAIWPHQMVWLTPVALALGAGLITFGAWILRIAKALRSPLPLATVERALLAIAVGVLVLALFWATNIFATKAGEVDGTNIAGNLWSKEATVILDTPDRLVLPKELIKESPLTLANSPQGETFRYECFREVAVRGDRWVLLPANWRPQFGYVVLVTANDSHRIILRTIKDAPERVGNGSNVREYWPCPELVPTATGPQVEGQLLPAEDMRRILGASDLVVTKEYKQPTKAFTSPGSPRSCVGAVDSALKEEYSDSNFKMRYGRELAQGRAMVEHSVDESVIEFETPHRAADFVDTTKSTWQGCAHTALTLTNGGSTRQYKFGDFADGKDTGNVATIALKAPHGSPPVDCSHAVAAKSNVVVDVEVCGSEAHNEALTIVNKIRDRFPI
jgi:PknH-like protein